MKGFVFRTLSSLPAGSKCSKCRRDQGHNFRTPAQQGYEAVQEGSSATQHQKSWHPDANCTTHKSNPWDQSGRSGPSSATNFSRAEEMPNCGFLARPTRQLGASVQPRLFRRVDTHVMGALLYTFVHFPSCAFISTLVMPAHRRRNELFFIICLHRWPLWSC